MTGGGPANSTITVNLLIYRNAFEYLRMGRATAMAYFLFAAIMIVTLISSGARKVGFIMAKGQGFAFIPESIQLLVP